MVSSAIPIAGGDGYSTYQVDIIEATPTPDSIDIFIEVECEEVGYQGLLPGEPVTAYFLITSDVAEEPVEENCDFNDDIGIMRAVWDWHNVWYYYLFKLDPPSDW